MKSLRLSPVLAMMVLLGFVAVGCAKNGSTLPEEEKLADADLFDGLKEDSKSKGEHAEVSEDKLLPAEDAHNDNQYSGDNLVAGSNAGGGNYTYYYKAVGGESLGRVAYAIYNNRHAVKRLLKMNPDLKGLKTLPADAKVAFDMSRANPRSEYLTKDMLERYKSELVGKIREKRLKAGGNEQFGEVQVQKGETLQAISQRIYGTTRLWTEIFLLNQDTLHTYDQVKVGMTLKYFPVSDFSPASSLASGGGASDQKVAPETPDSSPSVTGSVSDEQSVAAATQAAPVTPAVETQKAEAAPVAPAHLPSDVKDPTHSPPGDPGSSGNSVVKGGIPVDSNENLAAAGSLGAPGNGGPTKQIRPPAELDPDIVGEESFFAANARRIIYIGLIVLIIVGGYFLTKQPSGFRKSKFSGIQPMPSPMGQAAPRPKVAAPPVNSGRVFVNRTGTPPSGKTGTDQKTG